MRKGVGHAVTDYRNSDGLRKFYAYSAEFVNQIIHSNANLNPLKGIVSSVI
jgi:hypothetical protein